MGSANLTAGGSVQLGEGDGSLRVQDILSIDPDNLDGLELVDLNADGLLDIVEVQGSFGPDVTVRLALARGGFDAEIGTTIASFNPGSVRAADLNADTFGDLVIGSGFGGMRILLGTGNGSFQSPIAISTPTNAQAVALVDLNGDSNLDIVSERFAAPERSTGRLDQL